MFRPGLDHPPPGIGEGLRERDMPTFGVPNIQNMVSHGTQTDIDCATLSARTAGTAHMAATQGDADVPGTGVRGG